MPRLPRADRGAIVGAAQLRQADVDRLAAQLYRLKSKAYRDTLTELSGRHGAERSRAVLSDSIREALKLEADHQARMTIDTFNRMVSDFAERRRSHPPDLLAREITAYMKARAQTRARLALRMAPTTARLDATIAFYRENGVEPEFDFVGPRPQCQLCKKLKNAGPYPVDAVLAIGFPHLGCTHTWRARTKAKAALEQGGIRPGQISAGRGNPAGILNSTPLLQRAGGHDQALDVIDQLAQAVAL